MAQQIKMNAVDQVASWLILAGALNWGTRSFFNLDIVQYASMAISQPELTSIIYKTVGIAAVYFIYRIFRRFK